MARLVEGGGGEEGKEREEDKKGGKKTKVKWMTKERVVGRKKLTS